MSLTPGANPRSKEHVEKDVRLHTFTNDMRKAQNRKLNPIPRKKDVVYDLNGRPIYMGNATAGNNSPRIK
jgi:hypothetical protein